MPSSVVDAPDLSGLIELSRDRALDLKPVILRVQTDLFLAAPVRDRAVLSAFASLATGLIATVDDATALIVARKLAACPDTPRAVLDRLAARGGAVAEAVAAPPSVDTPDAPSVTGAAAASEPARPPVADPADAATAAGAEPEPLPRGETLLRLVAGARREPRLARALLARSELPAADLAPLWLYADPPQRAGIVAATEATAALRPCPPAPRGLGTALCTHAAHGDLAGFVAALAEGLGLGRDFLGAAVDPATRYDLLALALRAADLSEAEAAYVFLTLNETVARSVERVFGLVSLFRSLGRAAARDLLGAILDVDLPERVAGEHQPYYAPDGGKPRSGAERAPMRPALPGRVRRTG